MILRPGTWDELGIGNYLQSPDLQIWRVDDERGGWLLVSNPRNETMSLPPQPPATPCTIMEPTEAEAIKLLSEVLGAQILGELEALAAQPTRAARRRRPFPSKTGPGALIDARGHLVISHQTYVDDIKGFAGLVAAHEGLHDDATHIMAIPHHH